MTIIDIILFLILAIIFTYFVDYLCDVLPFTRKFSQLNCLQCGTRMPIWDFIRLHRCNHCGALRNKRIWFIFVWNGILIVLLNLFPMVKTANIVYFLIAQYFLVIIIIDIEHRAILNQTSLFGIVAGLALGFLIHGITSTLIGALSGFLIFLALYYLGIVFSKLLGALRHQAIDEVPLGYGDVNLSAIIGAFLGWPLVLAGLFFAIASAGVLSGAVILVRILKKKYQPFQAIPYAPFIALSALVLMYLNFS